MKSDSGWLFRTKLRDIYVSENIDVAHGRAAAIRTTEKWGCGGVGVWGFERIVKNFIQNKSLLHDGIEYDFIYKRNFIDCPCCSGKIFFSVYGSKSFNSEELGFKSVYSKK